MIPLSVILILAGLLAVFLGFKGRIVQSKGPRCPNPRCFYPLAASLERRAEQHEGVEYGYPIVCPECGHMTASPVEARWSYRKFRMRRVYLGLALLVISAPLLIGANMFRNQSPFIMRNLPTPILLHLATIGNQYEPRAELLRRVQAGEYTGKAADRVAERLIHVQSNLDTSFSILGDSLFTLIADGHVSATLAEQATLGWWKFEIEVAHEVSPSARIPIEIVAHYRGPSSQFLGPPSSLIAPNWMRTYLLVKLDRISINNSVAPLPQAWSDPYLLTPAAGESYERIRFTLPLEDPAFDAALAAPTDSGVVTVSVDASWDIESTANPQYDPAAVASSLGIALRGNVSASVQVSVTPTRKPTELVASNAVEAALREGYATVQMSVSHPSELRSPHAMLSILGATTRFPEQEPRPHVIADRWIEWGDFRFPLPPLSTPGDEAGTRINPFYQMPSAFIKPISLLAQEHLEGWMYVIHPRPDLAEKTVHVDRVWAGDDIRIPVTVETTPP
jgi:hypothetical protein